MKISISILAGTLAGLALAYGVNNAKACDFNDVPEFEKDKIVYADSGALLSDGETPYVIVNEDVNGTVRNLLYVPGEDNATGECHVYEVDITGFAGPNAKIEAAEFVLEEGYLGELYRLLDIDGNIKKSQYLDLVTIIEREEDNGELKKYLEIYRYSEERGWNVLESLELNDDIVGLKLKKVVSSLKPEIIINKDGKQYLLKEGFLGFTYLEPVERKYRNVLGKILGITQNGDKVEFLTADVVYKLVSVSSEEGFGRSSGSYTPKKVIHKDSGSGNNDEDSGVNTDVGDDNNGGSSVVDNSGNDDGINTDDGSDNNSGNNNDVIDDGSSNGDDGQTYDDGGDSGVTGDNQDGEWEDWWDMIKDDDPGSGDSGQDNYDGEWEDWWDMIKDDDPDDGGSGGDPNVRDPPVDGGGGGDPNVRDPPW